MSKTPKLLWQHPSPQATAMYEFLEHVNGKYGLRLSNYEELHRWSIDQLAEFWGTLWTYVGVRAKRQATRVSVAKSIPNIQTSVDRAR